MWQVKPGQALRFRQFDDDFVLYNDLSGDTHLLGDGAVHVLGVLQHGAASEASLRASLAALLAPDPADPAKGDDDNTDEHDPAGALLAQLASLFLIERLP